MIRGRGVFMLMAAFLSRWSFATIPSALKTLTFLSQAGSLSVHDGIVNLFARLRFLRCRRFKGLSAFRQDAVTLPL